MTERYYDDGTEPTVLPHMRCCSGPCEQGRLSCPTPQACLVPTKECSTGSLRGALTIVGALAVLVLVLTCT